MKGRYRARIYRQEGNDRLTLSYEIEAERWNAPVGKKSELDAL